MTPPKRQLYISQERLATVVILSNELAQVTNANLPPLVGYPPSVTDYKSALAELMDEIMKDLLAGATIEDGSHIAWIERELQTDVHSVPQLCTKVFVR